MAVNIGLAKRSAKDTLGSNIYNDFTSNDAGIFEKAEKEKFDDTVRSPPQHPKGGAPDGSVSKENILELANKINKQHHEGSKD
ncbi:hypothetical protein [Bartonella apihabitans]|uniref:hypothetical protein n=1 Tax=Bartonella apihabitans TaxID=2750929 RepID=UPI003BB51A10